MALIGSGFSCLCFVDRSFTALTPVVGLVATTDADVHCTSCKSSNNDACMHAFFSLHHAFLQISHCCYQSNENYLHDYTRII